jgi:hypothetical protein
VLQDAAKETKNYFEKFCAVQIIQLNFKNKKLHLTAHFLFKYLTIITIMPSTINRNHVFLASRIALVSA